MHSSNLADVRFSVTYMVSLFLTFFSVPSKRGSSESSGARLALADEQKEKERAGPPEDVASYRKNARVGGT